MGLNTLIQRCYDLILQLELTNEQLKRFYRNPGMKSSLLKKQVFIRGKINSTLSKLHQTHRGPYCIVQYKTTEGSEERIFDEILLGNESSVREYLELVQKFNTINLVILNLKQIR